MSGIVRDKNGRFVKQPLENLRSREDKNKYQREWYQKNKDKAKKSVYAWNERNKEKRLKYIASKNKEYHKINKLKIISHYGGKCECCGEKQLEFLSVDHKNGGGNKHKKDNNMKGQKFYRWIISSGFPEDLRILCMNCNCSYGWFGYCPHKIDSVLPKDL